MDEKDMLAEIQKMIKSKSQDDEFFDDDDYNWRVSRKLDQEAKDMLIQIQSDKDWYNSKIEETEDEDEGPSYEELEDYIETILDALDRGETPEWLILKGDPEKKKAAEYWATVRKKIEVKRKIAAEDARREGIRKAALDKLSAEEKEILGIMDDDDE